MPGQFVRITLTVAVVLASVSAPLSAQNPPPPITQAQVDALITDLNSNMFAVRQAAQRALTDSAFASARNLKLIKERLNAPGQGVNDPDINTKKLSQEILDAIPFDPLNILIDDRTETVRATSDGPKSEIEVVPGPPEIIHIRDPFFAALSPGVFKTIFLTEGGPLIDGKFSPVSDIISIDFFGGSGYLLFNSDTDDGPLSGEDCTNPDSICMPETAEGVDAAKIWFGPRGKFMSILVMSDVPEPSTAVLLVTGLCCLAAPVAISRRRRRGPRTVTLSSGT